VFGLLTILLKTTVEQKVSKWSSKKKVKGRKNKADEQCKGLLDRFVVVVGDTG